MIAKLSTITTSYRRFSKNQVLTAGHLNEILDFFDDQDRLSRVCLSGAGVVCGFKIGCDEDAHTVSLTQGVGVTTDGDLFHLYHVDPETGEKDLNVEKVDFAHYKVHDDSNAGYKPYFYDGDTQLTMYELLTDEQQAASAEDTFSLSTLEANEGLAIKDAVVLLYLECYEKEKDLCVSLTCDNQGEEVIANFKVLIVSKEVADKINAHDSHISKVNYQVLYHQLPDIHANRVVMRPSDFVNYNQLKNRFADKTMANTVVDDLKGGYDTLLSAMGMPNLSTVVSTQMDALFGFTADNVPPDFQYRYDLLKDLVDTYREIRELLHHLEASHCCIDTTAFPKHLMLGELTKSGPCYTYRHSFYKSPLLTGEDLGTCTSCSPEDTLEEAGADTVIPEVVLDSAGDEISVCFHAGSEEQRLFSLIKRAAQLLENYNANYTFIKITPSFEWGSLRNKAIPFYTNVGEHLIALWDFERTARAQQRENLSYHRDLLNTKRPLEIAVDHDFYRIEGHQGRNYQEALQVIEEARSENGLGFNVIALGISPSEAEVLEGFTEYYLNKHHGFEHKAGVVPGGTFMLIYLEGELSPYPYPYGYGYPYSYPGGDSLAGDMEAEAEGPITVINPVVADFSLPYLCCGESGFSLSLPVDELCFDGETEPLPFTVSPTGGFVAAELEEGLNGGVTTDATGAFVFDPRLVSEDLYGTPIKFTVNNLPTDCEITIRPKPQFNFESRMEDLFSRDSVPVIFTITGDDLTPGLVYTWDFGDGSGPLTSKDLTVVHTYDLYLLDPLAAAAFVSLTAGEGDCSHKVEHIVEFSVPPADVTVDIDTRDICREDNSEHILTVSPPGTQATLTGEGVSRNDGGEFVFVATEVSSSTTSVTVLVNGTPSNLTISIIEPPLASFDHIIDENGTLVLSNNSQNAQRYLWRVEQEEIERTNRSQVRRSIFSFNSNKITVSLTAFGEICEDSVDGPREIFFDTFTSCLDEGRMFVENGIVELENLGSSINDGATELLSITLERTIGAFKEVNIASESFLNGNNNAQLPELFNLNLLGAIPEFQDYFSDPNNPEHGPIRTLEYLRASLLYTLLKCQEPSTLLQGEDLIGPIMEEKNQFYDFLLELEFNIDKDGAVKTMLQEMKAHFEDRGTSFILKYIDHQLDNLQLSANF